MLRTAVCKSCFALPWPAAGKLDAAAGLFAVAADKFDAALDLDPNVSILLGPGCLAGIAAGCNSMG